MGIFRFYHISQSSPKASLMDPVKIPMGSLANFGLLFSIYNENHATRTEVGRCLTATVHTNEAMLQKDFFVSTCFFEN